MVIDLPNHMCPRPLQMKKKIHIIQGPRTNTHIIVHSLIYFWWFIFYFLFILKTMNKSGFIKSDRQDTTDTNKKKN